MNGSEIEHLVTMSLFYQIAIGFIPLSFIHPIDPVMKNVCSQLQLAAKFLTFSLFMVLHCIERLTGLVVYRTWFDCRDSLFLFLSRPRKKTRPRKNTVFVRTNTNKTTSFQICHLQHTCIPRESTFKTKTVEQYIVEFITILTEFTHNITLNSNLHKILGILFSRCTTGEFLSKTLCSSFNVNIYIHIEISNIPNNSRPATLVICLRFCLVFNENVNSFSFLSFLGSFFLGASN